MDIKEIWSEFKDRITNPLFASFIISWLIYNWQIPIVLIFYKHEELIKTKTTYIDFILRHQNIWYMIIFPIASACVYTFGYPYVKRYVKIYLAGQDIKTDKELLDISDTGSVSVEKFLATKASLKKMEEDLRKLIDEEGAVKEENGKLLLVNKALETDKITLNNDHHEEITELNRKNANKIDKVNQNHDRTINSMNSVFQGRIDAIRKEHSDAINQLQDDITLKSDLIDKTNVELERISTRADYFISELANKDKAINDYVTQILSLNESINVSATLDNEKQSEIMHVKDLNGKLHGSYNQLLTKDYQALTLSTEIINNLLEEGNIRLSGDLSEKFLHISNRLNELQKDVSLLP